MNKLLIISLASIEEFIQQLPVLQNLRKKYPQHTLHLLADKSCKNAESLGEGLIDVIHYLDSSSGRDLKKIYQNQGQLVDFARAVISDLKSFEFAEVFNFSLNPLGAFVAKELDCLLTFGPQWNGRRIVHKENLWQEYLSLAIVNQATGQFSYGEILENAFGLKELKSQTQDVEFRDNQVCIDLWGFDFSDLQVVRKAQRMASELREVLGTYTVKIFVSPEYREKSLRYFKNAHLVAGSLRDLKNYFAQSRLALVNSQVSQKLAHQVGTAAVLLSKIDSEDKIFTEVALSWDLLSGEKISANRNLKNVFEKNVWRTYLNDQYVAGGKISSPLISFDFGGEKPSELTSLIAAKKEELEIQHYLAADIKHKLFLLESVETTKLPKSVFMDLARISFKILKNKLDSADYFDGFNRSFTYRYQSQQEGVQQLKHELRKIETLLGIKEQVIKKIETISQEGSLHAKGFEFVSETSLRADREVAGEHPSESEIL